LGCGKTVQRPETKIGDNRVRRINGLRKRGLFDQVQSAFEGKSENRGGERKIGRESRLIHDKVAPLSAMG